MQPILITNPKTYNFASSGSGMCPIINAKYVAFVFDGSRWWYLFLSYAIVFVGWFFTSYFPVSFTHFYIISICFPYILTLNKTISAWNSQNTYFSWSTRKIFTLMFTFTSNSEAASMFRRKHTTNTSLGVCLCVCVCDQTTKRSIPFWWYMHAVDVCTRFSGILWRLLYQFCATPSPTVCFNTFPVVVLS